MKIRNGFVSNSSSSSFLVGLPCECVTFEDFIKRGIYPWDEVLDNVDLNNPVSDCDTYSEETVTYIECLKELWDDLLMRNSKASMEKWIDDIHGGYVPSGNLLFDYTFVDTFCCPHNVADMYRKIYGNENADKIRKRLERIGSDWNSIVGEALVRNVFDMFEGNVYEIGYSDNDGQGLMEHGSFWKFVPHIRISHH